MRKALPFVLGSILGLPLVYAFDYYVIGEAFSIIINTIAEIFSPDFIYLYPGAQEGLMRALLFVLILVAVHQGLHIGAHNVLNNAAQWIIALVFAGFSLLTPNSILLSSIMIASIPLLVVWSMAIYAMFFLRHTRMHHFFGFIVMVFAFFIATWMVDLHHEWGAQYFYQSDIVYNLLTLTAGSLFFLLVIKGLIALFSGWGSGKFHHEYH